MPLSLPDSCNPAQISLTSTSVVGVTKSIYTGKQTVFRHPGTWWSAAVTLPAMSHKQAGEWIAFLNACRGQGNTFYLSPYLKNRGYRYSGAKVNGASQSGGSLVTDGWPVSAKVLCAGDYFSIDYVLYQSLNDVYSDDAGNATISVFPQIRSHSDNADIETVEPVGTFRLAANESSWNIDEMSIYGFSVNATEAL